MCKLISEAKPIHQYLSDMENHMSKLDSNYESLESVLKKNLFEKNEREIENTGYLEEIIIELREKIDELERKSMENKEELDEIREKYQELELENNKLRHENQYLKSILQKNYDLNLNVKNYEKYEKNPINKSLSQISTKLDITMDWIPEFKTELLAKKNSLEITEDSDDSSLIENNNGIKKETNGFFKKFLRGFNGQNHLINQNRILESEKNSFSWSREILVT